MRKVSTYHALRITLHDTAIGKASIHGQNSSIVHMYSQFGQEPDGGGFP